MSALISIITTVYNREDYLPKAIESVLTQTYSDLELVIWDDGSTDHSLEIAFFYAKQDNRIRVFPAIHQGRGHAVANACTVSSGTYLGLLDSDDLLSETALEETILCFKENKGAGLVYTDYIVIDEEDKFKQYGPTCEVPYSKERLLVEFMVFHFRLLRRSVYDKVGGFDRKFEYCQDYDLCLKVSETSEILHLRRPLYYYRQHKESISFEKRVEQLLFGKRAIENALERRDLIKDYELEFQMFARCSLYKRQKNVSIIQPSSVNELDDEMLELELIEQEAMNDMLTLPVYEPKLMDEFEQ
ncbi:glycosyltransferase [Nodosilinea sp. LEGE 07088]|uniref:glycosyltransferase n=1 Tax=Nodosilinea sp. LEGE 07088 TaxID=2777968 RepID=UPI00187F39C7|nr:glycosyltransferase [Nodosilinea sp. LEGE 07088]MBE9140487.1 glycosyltransferase [Nodosilinea sp. LEGE 07088]